MRVLPWNQDLFVDKESHPDLQLAPTTNQLSGARAPLLCFGCASAGLDNSSPLKAGHTQQAVVPGPLVSDKGKDHISDSNDGSSLKKIALKSSLKKPSNGAGNSVQNARSALGERSSDIPAYMERRKLRWTDACGSELVEIREFEPSERDGSDDEFENGNKRCSCTIM